MATHHRESNVSNGGLRERSVPHSPSRTRIRDRNEAQHRNGDYNNKRRSSSPDHHVWDAPIRYLRVLLSSEHRPSNCIILQFFIVAFFVSQVSLHYTLVDRAPTQSPFHNNKPIIIMATNDNEYETTTRKARFGAKPLAVTMANDHNVKEIGLSGCQPMYDWQTDYYPTCNNVHELEFAGDTIRLANHGLYRDVWEVRDGQKTSLALKTLRDSQKFNRHNQYGQRKDAILSEKLTSSKYIADIYGFCGFSALYDFAPNGTLQEHYPDMDGTTKLRTAAWVSRGLADVHGLGGGPQSPVVHADIAVRQFVYVRGEYLLNDFNTAGMLYWDYETQENCKHVSSRAYDKNRAPEEYISEYNDVDETIDVYSLGNIFYKLLMKERKYDDLRTKEAEKLILAGDIPKLGNGLEESRDPVVVALKKAMHMCLPLEPEKRATAKQVADFLEGEWEQYKRRQGGGKQANKAKLQKKLRKTNAGMHTS